MGWHRNLALREALSQLGVNCQNISARELSYRNSILDDLWAINVIRNYEGGKILWWSWLSRGLVTPELLAKWHFQGKLEDLNKTMKQVRKKKHIHRCWKTYLGKRKEKGNKQYMSMTIFYVVASVHEFEENYRDFQRCLKKQDKFKMETT